MTKSKKKKKPLPRGRQGGRKPLPSGEKRITMTIVVSLATAAWLRSQGVPPGRYLDGLKSAK